MPSDTDQDRPPSGVASTMDTDCPTYSIGRACRRLGNIGRTTLYSLIARGKLQSLKLGSRTLITSASIDALLYQLATDPERDVPTPVRRSMTAASSPLPKGDPRHLNQVELARRWRISPRSLERWRWRREGPRYLKIGAHVVYRLEDIEAYEMAQLHDGGR